MIDSEINKKVIQDEFEGEILISKFRLIIALIYSVSVAACSIMNNAGGYGYFPPRAFISSSINTIYSIIILFYLHKANSVPVFFKYFCVSFDMIIISISVWVGCSYIEICPPITYLSIWALFYFVLILIGSFRYSIKCAVFSGFFAGFCYFLAVYFNRHTIDLDYVLLLENNKSIIVSFPIINELFRVVAMIVTGIITAIACKRHFNLFTDMIQTQNSASLSSLKTIEQTRNIAEVISKSTDEIFLSSKEVFANANNQAASIQEIETTLNENVRIAADIYEKTSNVSSIAVKMENDVKNGFDVLERNVKQLINIKSKNDDVINGIISLGIKISKIRDIIKNINTITNQTKVIAFNTGLEAASAQDGGKRISVVASEITRLADDISNLTKQIKENAEDIQDSSSSLIITSEESSDQIIMGNNLIKELEDIFKDIRRGAETASHQAQIITVSTQKQQKSTEHINIAVSDISKSLTKYLQSTGIATASAEKLNELIDELGVILTDGDK